MSKEMSKSDAEENVLVNRTNQAYRLISQYKVSIFGLLHLFFFFFQRPWFYIGAPACVILTFADSNGRVVGAFMSSGPSNYAAGLHVWSGDTRCPLSHARPALLNYCLVAGDE